MDVYFSNFNTHLFLLANSDLKEGSDGKAVNASTTSAISLISSGTPNPDTEIKNVTMFTPPGVTKDVKRVKVISESGYDTIIPLGQASGDVQLSFVRPAVGIYEGDADTGTDTYTVLKKWFNDGIEKQVGAYKWLVYLRPRLAQAGDTSITYEAQAYHVLPTDWDDGAADPDNGQEYNLTLAVDKKPYAVALTTDDSTVTIAASGSTVTIPAGGS